MRSLKESAILGVKWTSVSLAGRQVIRIGTTVALARLLAPSDFGLVSMSMVLVGSMYFFRDLGASSAVVQRESSSPALVSTLFWVNLALSVVGSLLILAAAPLVASFYGEPRVAPVLSALALAYFIGGLSVQHQATLERALAFDKLAKAELAGAVVGAVVGVTAALSGLGVWSLVLQQLALSTVSTTVTVALARWRPLFTFSVAELRSVMGFGLNLTGSALLTYVARNADYVLIGRFLGPQALGYYALAYNLMLSPILMVSQVIDRVVFPLYSRLQHQVAELKATYLRVVSGIGLVAFPMLMGLATVVDLFVVTFFGERWTPVILLLVIIVPIGILELLIGTVGPIFMATGRTDWMFRWDAVATACMVAAFAVGLQWGLPGVAGAYAVVTLLLFVPALVYPFKLISCSLAEFGLAILRPFACGTIMVAAVLVARLALPATLPQWAALAILVALGAAVYAAASWTLNRGQVRVVLDAAGLLPKAREPNAQGQP